MVIRRVDQLKPHERNDWIYGGLSDEKMSASIKEFGVLTPLLITYDDRIIGGHRRWTGAKAAGLTELTCIVFPSHDEWDILEAVIENNRQREKTGEMEAREALVVGEIEAERARQRQVAAANGTNEKRGKGTLVAAVPQASENGKTREKVAERLGIGVKKADAAMKVGRALVDLENSEDIADQQSAAKLKKVLNERGVMPASALVPKAPPKPKKEELPVVKRATFNETNDKVSWARWTWNPVTGCLHDCPYCYARDIANRLYPQGFKPTFHADRLSAPANTALPKEEAPWHRRVFTCSMADLFGKWVPQHWIDAVFEQMRDNAQWEYLCLTKFPQRLAQLDWPNNAWMGTTVDRQYRVDIAEKAFRNVKAGVKWLSCEPMLEPLKFSSLEMFDWVVIGGASRSSQTEESWPEFEWVVDLYNQARAAGCGVWIKPNGIGDRTPRPQEMPR